MQIYCSEPAMLFDCGFATLAVSGYTAEVEDAVASRVLSAYSHLFRAQPFPDTAEVEGTQEPEEASVPTRKPRREEE